MEFYLVAVDNRVEHCNIHQFILYVAKMRMVYTFFFTLVIFLNSIELSSQAGRNPERNRNPGASSSARQHSPDQIFAEEPPLRGRSRSPQGTPNYGVILGYALSELGYIRLIPRTNKRLQFEFRRYIFPVGKPIKVRAALNRYVPVPTREHIVLSASNGDVFAIVDYSDVLRGIYRAGGNHERVKINIITAEVDDMTSDEAKNCPVGETHPIFPDRFSKVVTKNDSLQFQYGSFPSNRQYSPDRTSAREPPLRGRSRSPQGRPPFSEVLGYGLDELGYIRLIPHTNPNLQFEFRRYVFPDDQPIRVRGGRSYVPVPKREHIVLSASNGDICALLEYSGFLRGIYRTNENHSRVKINMTSGIVDNMTSDEVKDCPVGEKHPIFPNTFTKIVTNDDSLQAELNPNSQEINPLTLLAELSTETINNPKSRSLMCTPPSSEVLGYSLRELGYIRLCPHTNPNLQLKFRRYVFPDGAPIRVSAGRNRYVSVPTCEHIVLSASNGDIFALLEYSGVLRGIYKPGKFRSRVKINMNSGVVDIMTADEVRDCPVGENHPIFPQTFAKVVSKYDSLHPELNRNRKYNPGSSSSVRRDLK